MKKVDPMIEMELEENSQGDTIVRSCSFEYTYQDEDGAYQSEFFYQVDQRLPYFKNGDGLAQIRIEHGNPIDYAYWHQKVIPYSLALQSLGYDPVQTSQEWLATQKELQKTMDEIFCGIQPISKEEYEFLIEKTHSNLH